MNQEFLNTPIFCGIHTISILSNKMVENGEYKGIEQIKTYIDKTTGEVNVSLKINANTYNDDNDIKTYREYQEILAKIKEEIGVTNSILTRVDFKFDSYIDDYDRLFKIKKLIILLICYTNNIKNRYHSIDPLSLDNLTVRVQNDYLEAENYNKARQSDFKGNVQNRLELRCKSLSKTKKDIEECLYYWFEKLDKLPDSYLDFQILCNSNLMAKWKEEKGEKIKSLYEFLRKYQDNIFTRKQLINLFEQLGTKNPCGAADRFKQNNKIEYITKKNLKNYIENIKKAGDKFLNTK